MIALVAILSLAQVAAVSYFALKFPQKHWSEYRLKFKWHLMSLLVSFFILIVSGNTDYFIAALFLTFTFLNALQIAKFVAARQRD
jgi:hypothetical protein